jgi:hypothetical protein
MRQKPNNYQQDNYTNRNMNINNPNVNTNQNNNINNINNSAVLLRK